jgi:AraC-like DNA-binding protein
MTSAKSSSVAPKVPVIEVQTAAVEDLTFWHFDQDGLPYFRLYWNNAAGCHIEQDPPARLGPRQLVLVAPHTPTRLRQARRVGHLYIHFTVSPPYHHPRTGIWTFPLERTGQAQLERLFHALWQTPKAHGVSLNILSLLAQALALLPDETWDTPSMDQRVHTALLHIERHLHEALPVQRLANHVRMSEGAFARLFSSSIGTSPHRYILRRRVERAMLRLGASMTSIDDIARECGFCDRYHLGRVFKDTTGTSPAAFRARRTEAR